MKKIKKILISTLVGVAFASTLSGCESTTKPTESTSNITTNVLSDTSTVTNTNSIPSNTGEGDVTNNVPSNTGDGVVNTTNNENQELSFELNATSDAYIVKSCDSKATNIVIPEKYNGLPVKSISSYAFNGCTSLTSIEIANGVTNIEDWAFYNCTSLTSIIIPESITNIGGSAFFNCPIEEATIPYFARGYLDRSKIKKLTITIGNNNYDNRCFEFGYCSSLTSITLPNGIKTLGMNAFDSCTSLTSVSIPNSVTGIDAYAFSNCTSLESISIPDGVTTIGACAFYGCTSLTDVKIPNSVTSIDIDAFDNCAILNYNEYDNAYYLGNDDNPYLWLIKAKSKDITSCNINSNCKYIYEEAFRNCELLSSVTIPNSVTNIDGFAFYGCRSLKTLTIPDTITSIGRNSFDGCFFSYNEYENGYYLGNNENPYLWLIKAKSKTITTFNINSNCKYIFSAAFSGCTSLASITIPNGIINIGDWTFNNCTSLTNITIPNGITSIGWGTFYNCSSLINVELPDDLESIGLDTFEGCTALTYYEYDNGYYLGNENNHYLALMKPKSSDITSYNVNSNCKYIYENAFYKCYYIKTINIPESVKNISPDIFIFSMSNDGVINYNGTKQKWETIYSSTITRHYFIVVCTDGELII